MNLPRRGTYSTPVIISLTPTALDVTVISGEPFSIWFLHQTSNAIVPTQKLSVGQAMNYKKITYC